MYVKMEDELSTHDDVENDQGNSVKEFSRNFKEFRVEKNKRILRIIGNSNRIFVKQNCGSLEIIGNNTSVFIVQNCGKVEYTGSNGKVYFGDQSAVTNCSYCGTDGSVKILKEDVIVERSTKKEKKSSSDGETSNCDDLKSKSKKKRSKKDQYFVVKNTFSMPNLSGDLLHLNSEIKIRTSTNTDITINNRLSM